ncbi:unnamed protein product, partial [Rotaria sp. Silwood1]
MPSSEDENFSTAKVADNDKDNHYTVMHRRKRVPANETHLQSNKQ